MNSDALHTVCAIVVTYNRKRYLLECLEALTQQTVPPAAILIVDNASTDGTFAFLQQHGYTFPFLDRNGNDIRAALGYWKNSISELTVYYLRLPANFGGAGGFSYGLSAAFALGYHWFWMMDDDAEPAPTALEELLHYADTDAAAFGSLTRSKQTGEIQTYHQCRINTADPVRNFLIPLVGEDLEHFPKVQIDQKSFVGIFLPRRTVAKAGFPRKELFLHWDDTEYCLRLKKLVGNIYLIPSSVIWHKDVVEKSPRVPLNVGFVRIMRYAKRDPFDRYWLRYYTIRNMNWIALNVAEKRGKVLLQLLLRFLRSVAGVLLFDDRKWRRLRLLVRMYLDAIGNRFDTDPQWILYRKQNIKPELYKHADQLVGKAVQWWKQAEREVLPGE